MNKKEDNYIVIVETLMNCSLIVKEHNRNYLKLISLQGES